jgi:carbon monoxide dehydrogenase subunit G
MRIQDQGVFSLPATLTSFRRIMEDPDFLARALPDCRQYEVTGPRSFRAEMAVGVSHLKGAMPATVVIEPGPGEQLPVIRVEAQGLGSRVNLALSFAYQEQPGELTVQWTSDAMVTGMLASVGANLLRPLAQKNFEAIVDAIRTAVVREIAG